MSSEQQSKFTDYKVRTTDKGKYEIIAPNGNSIDLMTHRGITGDSEIPENTLKAYNEISDKGYSIVETDVIPAEDGYVIFHDELLEENNHLEEEEFYGPVYDKSIKELKELDLGNGEPIPTVNEGLEHLAEEIENGSTLEKIKLEFKVPDEKQVTEEYLEEIIEVIEETGVKDYVVPHSFDPEVLSYLKENEYDQVSIAVEEANPEALEKAEQVNADIIAFPYRDNPDRKLIEKTREEDYKVGIWGMEDEEEIKDVLYRFGSELDYLSFDHPEELNKVIEDVRQG